MAGLANGYTYVRGNPLSFIDPLGLYTEIIQWGPAPGWKSMWGHISGNINGDNWSWGSGGWDTRYPTAEDYANRQRERDIDRAGRGVILDLSSTEELLLAQCLGTFQDFNGILNNCGNPWVKCLQKLGVVNADDKVRVLPYDVYRILSSYPGRSSVPATRVVAHQSVPVIERPFGAVMLRRRAWYGLAIGLLVAGLVYVLSHGEAITLRALEGQPVTRSPIEPASGSNVVYVLKPGEGAEVIQCEDVKRPVILVRIASGETGYVDYGVGRFALDRQRIGLRLLSLSPKRITFSCHGMFDDPIISRYVQ